MCRRRRSRHPAGGPGTAVIWWRSTPPSSAATATDAERLEVVVRHVAQAVDAVEWALSRASVSEDSIETIATGLRRTTLLDRIRFQLSGERYRLADFPASARAVREEGAFTIRSDDPDADGAERSLLAEYDYASVTAVAVAGAGVSYLVELYGDRVADAAPAAAGALRLLCREAVRPRPARLARAA